jgi:hypothetical protein
MAQLAQQAHRLQPTKDIFDPFAFLLTDSISRMSGSATINGRAAISVVLGHVWRTAQSTQVFHEVPCVKFLSPANITRPVPLLSSAKAATARSIVIFRMN